MVLLLFVVPVLAATFFAIPLAGFADQPISAALRLSFNATFRNWLPLLVWGMVSAALFLLGVLALLVGVLVAGPVVTISYYRMYQTIFAPTEF